MTRIHIFCEGQTEETFVRELLYNHLLPFNIFVNPIVIRTSKTGRGGVSTYGKIEHQIRRKCLEDTTSFVTTMIDYYGLPNDFPGKNTISPIADPIARAVHVEQNFQDDIDHQGFIANLLIHEFEGLLFSEPDAFKNWFDPEVVPLLTDERSSFQTPEHINDDPQTAPSKRILRHCPGYEKVTHGSLIALDIGLDQIRNACPHFSSWLTRIEQLPRGQI